MKNIIFLNLQYKAKVQSYESGEAYVRLRKLLETMRKEKDLVIAALKKELLFLHDKRIPANNSLCERLAHVFKRKQKQVTVFRSQESLNYVCDGLSVVYLLRSQEGSVYRKITDIFRRKKPPRIANTASSMT